jgi:hypothetical protein
VRCPVRRRPLPPAQDAPFERTGRPSPLNGQLIVCKRPRRAVFLQEFLDRKKVIGPHKDRVRYFAKSGIHVYGESGTSEKGLNKRHVTGVFQRDPDEWPLGNLLQLFLLFIWSRFEAALLYKFDAAVGASGNAGNKLSFAVRSKHSSYAERLERRRSKEHFSRKHVNKPCGGGEAIRIASRCSCVAATPRPLLDCTSHFQ